jgi:ATP-dependent Clp protease ATP-binding subunit ClpC
MNEPTLTHLKIIVERAVRPVRASVFRKRKMREELLAHVRGVFEEEARLGDEQAALARAQERFGQAAELTGELQASVPRGDDITRFAENLLYGPGESALRVAAQAAAAVGAVSFVPLGITILIKGLSGQGSEWLTVARVPSVLAPLLGAFFAFCATLLYHGMRQALVGAAGRSWVRAGLIAAAAWLIIPAMTFAVCLAVSADIQGSFWDAVPLLPHGVLAPVVLVTVTCLVGSECRHDRDWASLRID